MTIYVERYRVCKRCDERSLVKYSIEKGGGWIVAATQTGWHVDGEELDDLIDSEMKKKT